MRLLALLLLLIPNLARADEARTLRIERPALVGLGALEGAIAGGLAAGHFVLSRELTTLREQPLSAGAEDSFLRAGRMHDAIGTLSLFRLGGAIPSLVGSAGASTQRELLAATGLPYLLLGSFDLALGGLAVTSGLLGAWDVDGVGRAWTEVERIRGFRSGSLHFGTGLALLTAGAVEFVFGLTRERLRRDEGVALRVAPAGAGVVVAGRF